MAGFTKLFSSIVTSTIWQEDDKTRIVWITMLAIAEAGGRVQGAIPGLAHIANVSIEECEHALNRLMAPDPYSRTKDNDGRRVKEIAGGWQILNYGKYRDRRDAEKRRQQNREAKRRSRAKNADCQPMSANVSQMSAQAEAEAEKDRADIVGDQDAEGAPAGPPFFPEVILSQKESIEGGSQPTDHT